MIKCCLIIGDILGAEKAIQKITEAGSDSAFAYEYKAQYSDLRNMKKKAMEYFTEGEHNSARKHFENFLRISNNNRKHFSFSYR